MPTSLLPFTSQCFPLLFPSVTCLLLIPTPLLVFNTQSETGAAGMRSSRASAQWIIILPCWWSSNPSYRGFRSQLRCIEGLFFSSSNTCADSSVLILLSCAQTKIIAHVKDPMWALFMLPFEGLTTCGMKTHRYCMTVAEQIKWWLSLLMMEEDEGEDNQEKTHQSHGLGRSERMECLLDQSVENLVAVWRLAPTFQH